MWSDPSSLSSVPLMIGGTEHEGIVALLEFLKDQTRLDKLNKDFATEGPALLLGIDLHPFIIAKEIFTYLS